MQKLSSLILDNNDVNNKLARIAFQIIEEYHNEKELFLVGISKNGFLLAKKINSLLQNNSYETNVQLIELKINKKDPFEKIESDFDLLKLKNKSVVLIDDVLNSGKTLIYATKFILDIPLSNFKTAVLSRGYKRETKGFVLLNENHLAIDVGDEPLQYFQKFKNIDVAVCANRVKGITNLIKSNTPEVILLDDAFQHRKVKGSFYILLTKFDDLFMDDFLLPMGRLRERREGAKRADVILVSKCPENLTKESQKLIKQKYRCCLAEQTKIRV